MRRAAPDPGRRVRARAPPPPGPHPSPIEHPATEHRTDGLRLHVAAAARRVGVAPSTLRTWDRRYGIGPTDHTPGRHRRYSPDDLARLDLMHRALILGATPADAAAHALTALPPHPDAARPPPATTGRHAGAGRTGNPGRCRTRTAATRSHGRRRPTPAPAPAGRHCACPAPDGEPAAWGGRRSRSTPTPSADCSPSRSP